MYATCLGFLIVRKEVIQMLIFHIYILKRELFLLCDQ